MSKEILKAISDLRVRVDKRLDNVDKRLDNVDKKLDKVQKDFNGYVMNTGRDIEDSVEDFFISKTNNKSKKIKIEGIKVDNKVIQFDSYERDIKWKTDIEKCQLDFLLINCSYIGVGEVKRMVTDDNIKIFFEKLPKFQESNIYKQKFLDKKIIPIMVSKIRVKPEIRDKFNDLKNNFEKAILLEQVNSVKFVSNLKFI